jgi:hypothetical protein
VIARWTGPDGREFLGDDYLGCCSYESEEDFRAPGGYFDDMKRAALDELNEKVRAHYLTKAAPKMLETLEGIISEIDGWNGSAANLIKALRYTARAAIAEAKGEGR